ncbi:MAG: adenosylcobinamide-phosphate synthase CbiB [Mariprofundaceae bacterium]|nr:adenosylcobinamide-phosphate synthase CbiB [Mariprofundaceae bacterium]
MTLFFALLLEFFIGDPENRWHPVAWFGHWATWCESFLHADDWRTGVVTWILVITLALSVVYLGHHLFGVAFDVVLVWLSIGWKSLFEHVRAVLEASSLAAARHAISRIVSRDTTSMSQEDCQRAALESLAENASDAVIAPLFWFLILGPMGAAAYRMINTLDAMWGYRNSRYKNFGYLAAKVDDIANYIPARITARLMLWVGQGASWQAVQQQARTHASPNAGYPEVALAFAATIQLGGDVMRDGVCDTRPNYGGEDARDVNTQVAKDAMIVVRNALCLGVAMIFLLDWLF